MFGWQCPGCGAYYSPYIALCYSCGPVLVIATSDLSNTPYGWLTVTIPTEPAKKDSVGDDNRIGQEPTER